MGVSQVLLEGVVFWIHSTFQESLKTEVIHSSDIEFDFKIGWAIF